MKSHRLTGTQFPYLLTDAALTALALRSFVVPASPDGYRFTLSVPTGARPKTFTTRSLRLAEDLARGAGHPLFIIEYGPAPEKDPNHG